MVQTVHDEDRVTTLALAAGRGDRRALEQFIDATQRDAGWSPLIDTPMHPEYPSAHSCITPAGGLVDLRGEVRWTTHGVPEKGLEAGFGVLLSLAGVATILAVTAAPSVAAPTAAPASRTQRRSWPPAA